MSVWKKLWIAGVCVALAVCMSLAVNAVFPPSYVSAVWQMGAPQFECALEQGDYVECMAFSSDGATLACGLNTALWGVGEDAAIKVWDVASRKNTRVLNGHTASVHSIAFSPNARLLASASSDKTMKLWDVAIGKNTATIRSSDGCLYVGFSAAGSAIAATRDGKTVKVRDVASGKQTSTLKGNFDDLHPVACSPDGKTLATAQHRTIKLWDIASGKNTITLKTRTPVPKGKPGEMVYNPHLCEGWAVSLAFSPDGKTIAAGEFDGAVRLWDVASGEARLVRCGYDEEGVYAIAFRPDGAVLASAGYYENVLNLWHVDTCKRMYSINFPDTYTTAVAFSPNGKLLACACEKTVKLFTLR